MKKYLMTGVAALAFAATFTSCSKAGDLYDEGRVEKEKEQAIVNSYEKAFEAAFGKVGANVDWGFSSKSSSTRAFTRAVGTYSKFKGNMTSSFNFPGDCDASKFLAAVPGGVQKMPANGEVKGGTYYIDNTTTKVNMNTGAGVIYVDGTVDLSSDNCFEITQNTEIYLVKGSTLKLGTNDANKLKAIIYIESTATLETANRLKMDNTSKVYNHGTINAGAFEVNNTSFLYNVGTLNTPNGLVYVANSNSSIVNDGTIIAGDVEVAGSGHVQNNAEWTVNGTTTVNSNSASWVNNGHWTTDYYKYTAGSENVINNCFLQVIEDFDMNTSSASDPSKTYAFKIDAGGGVLTKNFNGGKIGNSLSGPYRILMGSNAVFKVTDTAALAAGNVGTWDGGPTYGYGFYGVGDDYAVFQATHIVKGDPNVPGDKKVQYGGKLYVSAEDHFASELDAWNQCVTFSLGFTKNNIFTTNAEDEYSTGKPNITIQETPCNPGFSGKDPLYRVIAEDLTADQAGDFDFNDVVFDVVKYEGGKTTLRLQACGGTLKLKIGSTNGEGGKEVHELYGDNEPDATTGKYKMWNTGTGNVHDPVDFTIDGQYDTPERLLNLRIEVFKENKWMLLEAKRGVAACKILVDDRFGIVPERQSIANKYGNFTTYVQGNWKDENEQFWWIQTGN